MSKEVLRQYNPDFDKKEIDPVFISTQIETHLRERFNVLISTVEYGISNGHLVRKGKNEPFIESIKRGRDFIQRLSPDAVDFDREDAEIIGFEEIDRFFSNERRPLESKMLSISLRGGEGSKYQHNYYDIFTLKEHNGERYVELSRYSSALSAKDYAIRLGLPTDPPPTDAQFLATPIPLMDSFSAEQIHKLLHKEHDYMDPLEFEGIWNSEAVQDRVAIYIVRRNASSTGCPRSPSQARLLPPVVRVAGRSMARRRAIPSGEPGGDL